MLKKSFNNLVKNYHNFVYSKLILHNQSHAITRSFTLGTNFFHWTHFAMIRILLFLGNRKVINFFYSLVELQKSAKDQYATNISTKFTIWVKYMKPSSSWMRNHWESIIKGKINAQHFSNIQLKSGTQFLLHRIVETQWVT